MACKGLCSRYKAKTNSGNSHYELGHKRCSECDIFVKWDGVHCPCCNLALRTRPKNATSRYNLLLVRESRNAK